MPQTRPLGPPAAHPSVEGFGKQNVDPGQAPSGGWPGKTPWVAGHSLEAGLGCPPRRATLGVLIMAQGSCLVLVKQAGGKHARGGWGQGLPAQRV